MRSKIIIVGLLLAMPGVCFSFAYRAQNGVPSTSTEDTAVIWDSRQATVALNFGSAGRTLTNGTTSWDQNARDALNAWNTAGSGFRWSSVNTTNSNCNGEDQQNNAFFSDDACGQLFGDALGVTQVVIVETGGRLQLFDTDVVLNSNENWDAYDGNIQFDGNTPVFDFKRVVLHEFGHALGLEHPDEFGQSVTAVMNSSVSNVFELTVDDKSGVKHLYGDGGAGVAQPPPSGESKKAGGAFFYGLLIAVLLFRRR